MTSNSLAGNFIFDHLVACDPLIGHANMPVYEYNTDINDLASEMRRLKIAKAIVRGDDCRDVAGYFCNEMLTRAAAEQAGILPAWFLTPDGRGPDYNIAEVIKKMLAGNVRIAWTNPCVNRHYELKYAFRTWCCGGMMEALQSRVIPLLLSYDGIDLSDLHEIMTDFPRLRVILLNLPRLGRQAAIEELLKKHSELYLCFSPSFSVHGGYENLCARYGQHRWVWGMGYPAAEGGAAITGLVYSGLSREQMAHVAFKNIERLLAEVKT